MKRNYPAHYNEFVAEFDERRISSSDGLLFFSVKRHENLKKLSILNNDSQAKLQNVSLFSDRNGTELARVVDLELKNSEGNLNNTGYSKHTQLLNPFGISLELLDQQYTEYDVELDTCAAFIAEEPIKDEIFLRGLVVFQSVSKAIGEAATCNRIKLILYEDAESLEFIGAAEKALDI